MVAQQSLRGLAHELGVSVQYLSQVRLGKKPASKRLLELMSTCSSLTVNQNVNRRRIRVPGEGLEPTRLLHRRILSPLRLPIPPPRPAKYIGGDERIRTAE
jgi:hypothetical protein